MRLLKLLPFPIIALFSACEKKSDPTQIESTKSSERAETVKTPSSEETGAELDPEEVKRKALEERIKDMSYAEIEELLKNPTAEQKEELNDREFLTALFNHLGEIAPEKGAKLISLLHFSRQDTAARALFRTWAETDFNSAMAAAKTLEKRSLQKNAVYASLNGLSERDPSLAYELAETHDAKHARYSIMMKWLETDPHAAYAKTQDYSPRMRDSIQENMGVFLAKLNPEKLADIFNSLTDKEERLKFLKGASGVSDVEAQEHLQDLFNSLSDPEELVHAENFQTLIEARDNPEKIAHDLILTDIDNASYGLIRTTMSAWAESDLTAALDFIETLPENKKRNTALRDVLNTWADSSPQEALDYALTLPNDANSKSAVSVLGSSLARENPVTASETLFKAAPSIVSKEMTNDLYSHWSYIDLTSALSHVSTLPQDHPMTQEAIIGVSKGFGRYPEEALPWMETLPTGDALNQVSQNIATRWANSDIDATLDWANSLPDSSQRDHSIIGFAPALAMSDPMLAAEWSSSINDGEMRNKAIEKVYRSWSVKDGTAATEWLNSSELFTPEQRARLGK